MIPDIGTGISPAQGHSVATRVAGGVDRQSRVFAVAWLALYDLEQWLQSVASGVLGGNCETAR